MVHRIHILGASGSGTTTLGKELTSKLDCKHFDTDNYFWLPTNPPFQQKREVVERQKLLKKDLESTDKWILSGSLCGWGDMFIPMFDLVIYLWIQQNIRIRRLIERENQRYGEDAIKPKGEQYEQHRAFIEWASQYDEGGLDMRSRALHEKWMEGLKCPVTKIKGDKSVQEGVGIVLEKVKG